jgi:NhaC family Na+:H+ antiporter
MNASKDIHLGTALVPILVLLPLLAANVIYFGDDSLSGPNQLALLVAAAVGVAIGVSRKMKIDEMLDGVKKSISSTVEAILILIMIGALAGSWLISGVIPSLVVYGLKIAHPAFFLLGSTIVCALVSLASGSSWSTIATVGIALIGIGKTLGFSEPVIAGSIISGAYFGDKMSPMSDTTNLAAAMAGTDLFTHIRYMTLTTGPSFAINMIIFLILGLNAEQGTTVAELNAITGELQELFFISPILLLIPAFVLFLIIRKIKPLPALFLGSLISALFAVIFQSELMVSLSGIADDYFKASFLTVVKAVSFDTQIETSNPILYELLSSGGMAGMLNTVWLIICAMTFGGILDSIGALHKITASLLRGVSSIGGLVTTTVGSCVFVNLTASDQYLAIVLPGKMYEEAYEEMDLAPENLSRTLEDSGTVTSVLIPWNTCGATQSAVLGVSAFVYAPWCFFNYISPLMTLVFAYFGIRIRKRSDNYSNAIS